MRHHCEPAIDVCAPRPSGSTAGLVAVKTAIFRGLALARAVPETDLVALEDSVGRVLGEDLRAPFALPPFDNSAMDGYALRSCDVQGAGPWVLEVTARIAAGDDVRKSPTIRAGQAARIFTGAAIPAGADAVVMQEHATREGNHITLRRTAPSGACIRRAGEDASVGSILLRKGTLIGAREVGAIASVGQAFVTVRRRVQVALFCTGSELQQPGTSLGPGQIYNSNRYMMLAALRQPWAEVVEHGMIEDNPAQLRETLLNAASTADVVVTTGGVSVGEEDHMVAQLKAAGGEVEVLKIAMKPGKPLTLGRLGRAVFIGLPGNPVAAFTTWKVIGARIAEKLSGRQGTTNQQGVVEVTAEIRRLPGRQEYRPVRIVGTSATGHPRIEFLDSNYSAKISLICQSDGLAVIPAASDRLRPGDHLEFVPL